MAKARTIWICSNCEAQSLKKIGRCPQCEQWNTYVEKEAGSSQTQFHEVSAQELGNVSLDDTPRLNLRFSELNRVLGGGIVPGSLILIGGDPGGKGWAAPLVSAVGWFYRGAFDCQARFGHLQSWLCIHFDLHAFICSDGHFHPQAAGQRQQRHHGLLQLAGLPGGRLGVDSPTHPCRRPS